MNIIIPPAATRSGHWLPPSRHWSCPACPDGHNAGARWTARSPRCGKNWKPLSARHRSAVTWRLAVRSNLSCSNTLWSETTGRGGARTGSGMKSMSAWWHKQHRSHQHRLDQEQIESEFQAGERHDAMRDEAHAGENWKCVKHACCLMDSLRVIDEWVKWEMLWIETGILMIW